MSNSVFKWTAALIVGFTVAYSAILGLRASNPVLGVAVSAFSGLLVGMVIASVVLLIMGIFRGLLSLGRKNSN